MRPVEQRAAFRVAYHDLPGCPHFDFFLDWPGEPAALAAWRLPNWPPDDTTVVEPLPRHRRIYLHYEGPVAGGRGTLRHVVAGTALVTAIPGGLRLHFADNTSLDLPSTE